MNDNRITRVVELYDNSANKHILQNITVNILIESGTPVFANINSTVERCSITYHNDLAGFLSITSIVGIITDQEYLALHGEERFNFMTAFYGGYSNSRAVMYYDKKYKDIIIVPDQTDLIINASILSGCAYTILGKCITNLVDIRQQTQRLSDAMLPLKDTTNNAIDNLSVTKTTIVPTSISVANLYGVNPGNNNKKFTYRELSKTDSVTGVNANIGIQDFTADVVLCINLGTESNIFVTPNNVLPLAGFYKRGFETTDIMYFGSKKPANYDLWIILRL